MLAMVGMGSWLGVAIDTYQRLFRRTKRRIVIVYDLLFWIFQSILIFYVLYLVNHGELRFYIFLALLCGFSAYQSLLKTFYNRILEKLLLFSKKLYQFKKRIVTIFLFQPIFLVLTALLQILLWIGKGLLFMASFIFRILIFVLKPLFSPFILFGKFLWKLIPESIRIKVMVVQEAMKKIRILQWLHRKRL